MTATALTYDLTIDGYQAIDIGHVDSFITGKVAGEAGVLCHIYIDKSLSSSTKRILLTGLSKKVFIWKNSTPYLILMPASRQIQLIITRKRNYGN